MQHRDGYGNEHDRKEHRGNEISQNERDWALNEYQEHFGKSALDHQEDHQEDHQADHQEEFGEDDKAEATYTDYTDLHFRYRKKAHGRINGKKWSPPRTQGLHTPQFVRLQDLQSQKPAKAPAVEVDAADGQ